jgi:hypothetical protein
MQNNPDDIQPIHQDDLPAQVVEPVAHPLPIHPLFAPFGGNPLLVDPPQPHPEQPPVPPAGIIPPVNPPVNAPQPVHLPAPPAPVQLEQPAPLAFSNNFALHYGKLLKKPDEFAGKDRHACDDFVAQLKLFVDGNSHLFINDRAKVQLAATYLRGTAQRWFRPRMLKNTDPILDNFELFCKELQKALGDPDREKTMQRKLKALKQTNSASHYRMEFTNIIQYLDWDTSALKTYFYDGLKDSVKDILATLQDEPSDFDEYQELCVRIDNRLYERKLETKGTRTNNNSNNNNHKKEKDNNKNNSSSGNRPSYPNSSTTTTSTSTFKSAPMNVDSTSEKKYSPLTPEEKQRRKDLHLCLYCAGDGHIALYCPLKDKKNNNNRKNHIHTTLLGPEPTPESKNT